jgi:hypothetical protein
LSTRRRTNLAAAAVVLALAASACTEEQSKEIGRIPKNTVDKAKSDIEKAMQQGQGSDRLKEDRQ